MDIYDLIKDEERISFIGMCKNAGKTTVLNEVIKNYIRNKKYTANINRKRRGRA